MNHITIKGRLTADPELSQTQSGVTLVKFDVAVDRAYSKAGGEKQTDFFHVIVWRERAEFVNKYFKKGQEILLSGEMQSEKYQDKDGNNRIAWTINASNIEFCGSKKDNESTNATVSDPSLSNVSLGGAVQSPLSAIGFEPVEDDGDLPF